MWGKDVCECVSEGVRVLGVRVCVIVGGRVCGSEGVSVGVRVYVGVWE